MNKHGTYVVGVDVGGTHIASAVVDVQKKKILEHTYASSHVANMEPFESIMELWGSTLNKTISATYPLPIKGIAFAIPGPFNYKDGIALYPEGFKYGELYGMNIERTLSALLDHTPPLALRFLNDATSFAVGEAWLSEEKGHSRQLCITLGTGLGAGFIANGIPVVHGSSVPENGCLWNLPYKNGIADDYFSTRGCINAYYDLTGETVTGVKQLANLYSKDLNAQQMFADFGKELGDFLAPRLIRFRANTLVLGGNISKAYACFGRELQTSLNHNGVSLPIRISNHMEKAAIMGCTRVFEPHFWKGIKNNLPVL
ncbi:ROK family protein [Flagellimonas flava]|uniref:Glucokinase n=1 Tax=Flagellimonas flava TaxID=570519 RepID=A0A1M5M193_9FLAO|nr:ROK family protein [Allomuricauda flava]SHG71016.1 glucokinase [Allomuricauda flava]